jgi:hypothetical protein
VTTAGGTATLTSGYTFVPAPTITSISPASGPLVGGQTVTISGTNLAGASVTFGGAAATIVANSGTSITITTPAGTAGAANVVVTTAGGTATLTSGYTFVPAPTITAIAPTSGPSTGGQTVTITGTNLSGATVTFGGAPATVTSNSGTSITVATPRGAAGAANVVVTTAGGTATLAGGYTFVVLRLDASTAPWPRVLVWSDCTPDGNDGGNREGSSPTCAPKSPAFIADTLRNAAIPFTLVGDRRAFLRELRSGGYSATVIYQIKHDARHKGEDGADDGEEREVPTEALEDIHAGVGLLFIDNLAEDKDHDDGKHDGEADQWPLERVLGIRFRGSLSGPVVLDLLASPFTSPSRLTFAGNGRAIELRGAQAAATLLSTGAPAISYFTYGRGRTVAIPFDVELTPSGEVAALLRAAVVYVAGPVRPSLAARELVSLTLRVVTPPGGPAPLTITAATDPAMTIIDSKPSVTLGALPTWNVTLAADTSNDFRLWFRLPETAGLYEIKSAAGYQVQPPLVTSTTTFEVALDRVALTSALAESLQALRASVTSEDDVKKVDKALADFAAVRATPAIPDAKTVLRTVKKILSIIGRLREIRGADTTLAWRDAGRLLVYWQSRVSS